MVELMDRPPASTVLITDAGPSAPWLTMVHGASQSHLVFDRQVDAFREDFKLCLVDLPGHGRSRTVDGPFGPMEHAGSVLTALDAAGIDAMHYWGTHTGSAVALLLAVRHPQRFRSLILEGAVSPGMPMPAVSDNLATVQAIARRDGLAAAKAWWFDHTAWFDVIRAHPIECRADAHRAMIADFDAQPWLDARTPARVEPVESALASLDVPTLLINGEHELPDFVDVADRLEDILPRGARIVVPRGGGFPLWEFPDPVNAEVRRFLDVN